MNQEKYRKSIARLNEAQLIASEWFVLYSCLMDSFIVLVKHLKKRPMLWLNCARFMPLYVD